MAKNLHSNIKFDKDSLDLDDVNSSITGLENHINNNWLATLNINGTAKSIGIVSNLNNFYTGLTLVHECSTAPSTEWWFIVSGGENGTTVQLAFSLFNIETAQMRYCAGGEWSSWSNIKIS